MEDNWSLTEIMVYGVDWAHLALGGDQWQAFKHNDISVGSIKD